MMKKLKKLRVAVIFGGRSGEHEVSLVSAESVMLALNPKKYEVIPIGITKLGEWVNGENPLAAMKRGNEKNLLPITVNTDTTKRGIYPHASLATAKRVLQPFDVAFPVLHGPYGEDGTIQGMLEMANIPYVGCGVGASANAMDKFMSKIIFASYGLPQVKFFHCTRDEIKKSFSKLQKKIMKQIGLPCFVKPSNMGSSVGISKVKKISQLCAALTLASSFDSSVIVEEGIDAREIECAVLGNDHPIASVAGEIIPSREFYDYFAKYVDNSSRLLIPAPLTAKKMGEVQKLAIESYKALQCSGMGRVDFLMDRRTGKLYLNEINTIPGFTSISMYPKLWEASGIPYAKLLDRLIELALERHHEKQKNKISFESGSDWYQ